MDWLTFISFMDEFISKGNGASAIECAARALCLEDGTDPDWEGPDPLEPMPAWKNYVKMARVALNTMRKLPPDVAIKATLIEMKCEPVAAFRQQWEKACSILLDE